MIEITNKTDCCGCSACEQVCPKKCISLKSDNEGFWYPEIDKNICVECNRCQKVCPVLNQDAKRTPMTVYAASNKDEEIRSRSASGGIFSVIAEKAISMGGYVFGVRFNKSHEVLFDYTDNVEGIDNFRRSKYVQAWMGDTFSEVSKLLKLGKIIVFTGTPCQIAGLRHYLAKDYDNLILVDLICEGVPSPKVWKKYLDEEKTKLAKDKLNIKAEDCYVENISFRNKSNGWKQYSFSMDIVNKSDSKERYQYINRYSAYLQSFTNKLTLRPICYECPFKSCKSHSDITIADYWGINQLHPEVLDDDKGISMVYVNTPKGKDFLDINLLNYRETTYEEAFKYNNIVTSAARHLNRDSFYKDLDSSPSVIKLLYKHTFTPSERLRVAIKSKIGFKATRFVQKILEVLR